MNDTVTHRGYTGHITYEPADDLFYAECKANGDMLVGTGDTAEEAAHSFTVAVDVMLDSQEE